VSAKIQEARDIVDMFGCNAVPARPALWKAFAAAEYLPVYAKLIEQILLTFILHKACHPARLRGFFPKQGALRFSSFLSCRDRRAGPATATLIRRLRRASLDCFAACGASQ